MYTPSRYTPPWHGSTWTTRFGPGLQRGELLNILKPFITFAYVVCNLRADVYAPPRFWRSTAKNDPRSHGFGRSTAKPTDSTMVLGGQLQDDQQYYSFGRSTAKTTDSTMILERRLQTRPTILWFWEGDCKSDQHLSITFRVSRYQSSEILGCTRPGEAYASERSV